MVWFLGTGNPPLYESPREKW